MYIGIKPVISKGKNHNKMEQRILKEQSIQGTNYYSLYKYQKKSKKKQ